MTRTDQGAAPGANNPGQILLIGKDGIWETHNESGEMFGKKRLSTLIRENAKVDLQLSFLAVPVVTEDSKWACDALKITRGQVPKNQTT